MPPPRVAPAALFMMFIGAADVDVFRRVGETVAADRQVRKNTGLSTA